MDAKTEVKSAREYAYPFDSEAWYERASKQACCAYTRYDQSGNRNWHVVYEIFSELEGWAFSRNMPKLQYTAFTNTRLNFNHEK